MDRDRPKNLIFLSQTLYKKLQIMYLGNKQQNCRNITSLAEVLNDEDVMW